MPHTARTTRPLRTRLTASLRYIAAADQTHPVALAEFNLVPADDYRVPDGGPQRPGPDQLCLPTAALALEVISLGDQTPEKTGFDATHHVDELLIVEPRAHTITRLGRHDDQYRPIAHSRLIELAACQADDQRARMTPGACRGLAKA